MTAKPPVLIVEDSKSVTLLLTSFLNKLGYSDIHSSDNGYSAIRKFKKLVKEEATPIVLLDYILPDMDCRSILTQMLDIQPTARVILQTATEQHDDGVTDLIRLGVYQYLEKPIRFEILKNVFDTLEKEDLFFKTDLDKQDIIGNVEEEIKSKLIDRINFILNSTKQVSLNLIEQMIGFSDDAIKSYLKELEQSGKIINLGEKKEIACNKCNSVKTTQLFSCPHCNSSHFRLGKLIEHYGCGNVSEEQTYKDDMCPHCLKKISAMGVDHRIMSNHYICNDCSDFFSEISSQYLCLKCENKFKLDEVNWQTSCNYKLAVKNAG
jgi:response regulator of citrate/malate metabolism/DNA-directed RNA polymerase subunit RPC12/RpoP